MSGFILPPPLSKEEIVRQARNFHLKYANSYPRDYELLGVNFNVMYEKFIYPEYEIELIEDRDLGCDESGEKILGIFNPESNRAFIDSSLKDDPRRVFTCWHEVGGHAILQGEWLRKEMKRIGEKSTIVSTDPMLSSRTINTLEWQANCFAAEAGAPMGFVNFQIKRTLKLVTPLRFCGPGCYSFDSASRTRFVQVSDFQHLCRVVAGCIRYWFGGFSVEALSYQVAQSRWVIDTTAQQSVVSGFGLKRTAKRRSAHGSVSSPELVPMVG